MDYTVPPALQQDADPVVKPLNDWARLWSGRDGVDLVWSIVLHLTQNDNSLFHDMFGSPQFKVKQCDSNISTDT